MNEGNVIYEYIGKCFDGTFSGNLTDGNGITAELIAKNGIIIFGESNINEVLKLE